MCILKSSQVIDYHHEYVTLRNLKKHKYLLR